MRLLELFVEPADCCFDCKLLRRQLGMAGRDRQDKSSVSDPLEGSGCAKIRIFAVHVAHAFHPRHGLRVAVQLQELLVHGELA